MKRQDGVTLVELLVVVVLLGIIIVAISSAIIVGLKTTDDTHTRLAESHDAQMVTAFFVPDAQSASDVSMTDTTCSGGPAPVVRFRWTDEGVTKVASYIVSTVGSQQQLHRRFCENGTLQDTIVVVRYLGSGAPTVSCPGSCTGSPARIALTVSTNAAYSFSVAATRRTA